VPEARLRAFSTSGLDHEIFAQSRHKTGFGMSPNTFSFFIASFNPNSNIIYSLVLILNDGWQPLSERSERDPILQIDSKMGAQRSGWFNSSSVLHISYLDSTVRCPWRDCLRGTVRRPVENDKQRITSYETTYAVRMTQYAPRSFAK